jgi:osmotically inducible lipoprotein OsmB
MKTTIKRLGTVAILIAAVAATAGCGDMTTRQRDTGIGAVGGGVAGAALGGGVLGTAAGAAAGGLIGNQVGK